MNKGHREVLPALLALATGAGLSSSVSAQIQEMQERAAEVKQGAFPGPPGARGQASEAITGPRRLLRRNTRGD